MKLCRALRPGKVRQPIAPAGPGAGFVHAEESEPDQRVVQLVGVGGLGPCFAANAGDRLRIEPAKVGRRLRREPAPAHHGLGAALLQRRVVEIGVGPRREHLERQRRRLGQVAGDDANVASFDALEQALETGEVHRLVQAVRDSLAHQRMVRDFALAGEIFGTGDLVGKHRRDQILGAHAGELRRHLLAATKARQRQRHADDPAPARDEHRRIEQRLDQQRSDGG